jgi:hypothetical protein
MLQLPLLHDINDYNHGQLYVADSQVVVVVIVVQKKA